MATPSKVVERYLAARELTEAPRYLDALRVAFAKLLLPKVEVDQALEVLSGLSRDELGWVSSSSDPKRRAAWEIALKASNRYERAHVILWKMALPFFRGLLSTYPLQGKTLKGVEKACQFYGKSFRPRVEKFNYPQYIQTYFRWVAAVEETFQVAEQAIREGERALEKGDATQAPRKLNAGSFTVVNSGGFDLETMERVAKLVTAADQALHKHGFGVVCYGDVEITNSILRDKALAFFNPSTDEIFVRADAKAKADTLRTILHELGHRLVAKDRAIRGQLKGLYMMCDGQHRDHLRVQLQSPSPDTAEIKPGDTIQVKRTRYTAVAVRGSRVYMRKNDEPQAGYSMPVQDWLNAVKRLQQSDPDVPPEDAYEGGFVTAYAKAGGPEENFCEMLSFYCLGKLRPNQLELFEKVIKG